MRYLVLHTLFRRIDYGNHAAVAGEAAMTEESLFHEALAKTPDERAAFLDRVCAKQPELRAAVEALLAAHEASGSLLDKPPADLGLTVDSEPGEPQVEFTGDFTPQPAEAPPQPIPTTEYDPAARPGTVIAGRYTLVEKIGEGGMGEVWVAKQTEPVKRKVALKLIKAGMDSKAVLQRFEQERQALALMDHPNIARVLDGGMTADRRPFFVMELVNGLPLTKFCDQAKLGVRERLVLFTPICQAVQHAHQKGIIHRDLKPSNVLVTIIDGRPIPKVIDFGVAKATSGRLTDESLSTQFGAVLGTLEYMSPEQAGFAGEDIDTRADIYSLGVILYELLTGLRPIDGQRLRKAALTEMIRIIKEEEPSKPSTRLSTDESAPSLAALRHTEPKKLAALLRGELDWVVMKCLEKQRDRRYETANALARDIQRYLADEVVEARPPSASYRLKKFVRRYKGQVIAASLVLFALVGGIVGTTLGLFEARRQEQETQKEADKAKKARDFLVSIFRINDIQAGNTTTARQILNQAEHRIPIEFANQPELRDELLAAIEDVNRNLDRTIPAAMILEARGAVQLHSLRGVRARPVPQTLLYPDDCLTLAADAQVQLIFLSDLHKERLQPGRETTIGRKGCSPADAVRESHDNVLMTFVHLPKGTFYMGWDGTPSSAKETEIKEDFEIAVHDVTQGQWEAIMGSNPSWFSRKGPARGYVLDISDEELKLLPVEMVSWDDAQAFLKKLNEKERGRGYLYRLPTEAEWEYACRGGATSLEECSYHFYLDTPTNDLSSMQANFGGDSPFGKAPKGPYLSRPTRVGAYPSNKLGLCDMHGNMWQWTATALGSDRVVRGGCWLSLGASCQAANPVRLAPTYMDSHFGFRLARVPDR
jgi:serine/threonine protein kinase/formylglycine-generating enzyme required for sulfatase activity